MTGEELDAVLLELRQRGMPYSSLAIVADHIYGWKLDAEVIRRRLRRHYGVAPDPTRQRFGDANHVVRGAHAGR